MSISTGQSRVLYDCDICHRPKCAHLKSCPSCKRHVFQYSPAVRGEPSSNGAWLCLRCPTIVCVWCYHEHTQKCFAEVAA